MRISLLTILLLVFTVSLPAQKDTVKYISPLAQQDISKYSSPVSVTIFPVPVRENSFTIRADKDITLVRITNIIGQDIFRIQYNDPQPLIKIFLDNPKRGMYLVTIIFSDGSRVVKKIMIEESE